MAFDTGNTERNMRIAEMIDHVFIGNNATEEPSQIDQALAAPIRTISLSLVRRL